jgi:DNA-binding transcriptional regulator LsrR (DeoR family)
MQHIYSDERLRLAARLYYVDGLGQAEVARLTNVSQAKVSRLLALARERGIVRITVADYDPRQRSLEARLNKELGLEIAIVVRTLDELNADDLRRSVGHFGASAVQELIKPKDVIALAGGRTIRELVEHLPEAANRAVTVVQAMGSVDSNISEFDAQEVGRVLAQRLGGNFLAFNTPAFIPEKRTRDALLGLEQLRGIQTSLSRSDLALVGIGTLANSVFVERGVIGAAAVAELTKAGAVGEICGRFIDEAGKECATAWRDQVMSVDVAQLRRIPRVIAIVSGSDRSTAILAAVRGGLLKGLVIDEAGANALLATAVASTTSSSKKKRRAG